MADHSRVEMLGGGEEFDPAAVQQLMDDVMADRPDGEILAAFETVTNAAADLLKVLGAYGIRPDTEGHPGIHMAAGVISYTFTAIDHWLSECCAGRLVSLANNIQTLEAMREAAERKQQVEKELNELLGNPDKTPDVKTVIKAMVKAFLVEKPKNKKDDTQGEVHNG